MAPLPVPPPPPLFPSGARAQDRGARSCSPPAACCEVGNFASWQPARLCPQRNDTLARLKDDKRISQAGSHMEGGRGVLLLPLWGCGRELQSAHPGASGCDHLVFPVKATSGEAQPSEPSNLWQSSFSACQVLPRATGRLQARWVCPLSTQDRGLGVPYAGRCGICCSAAAALHTCGSLCAFEDVAHSPQALAGGRRGRGMQPGYDQRFFFFTLCSACSSWHGASDERGALLCDRPADGIVRSKHLLLAWLL